MGNLNESDVRLLLRLLDDKWRTLDQSRAACYDNDEADAMSERQVHIEEVQKKLGRML